MAVNARGEGILAFPESAWGETYLFSFGPDGKWERNSLSVSSSKVKDKKRRFKFRHSICRYQLNEVIEYDQSPMISTDLPRKHDDVHRKRWNTGTPGIVEYLAPSASTHVIPMTLALRMLLRHTHYHHESSWWCCQTNLRQTRVSCRPPVNMEKQDCVSLYIRRVTRLTALAHRGLLMSLLNFDGQRNRRRRHS